MSERWVDLQHGMWLLSGAGRWRVMCFRLFTVRQWGLVVIRRIPRAPESGPLPHEFEPVIEKSAYEEALTRAEQATRSCNHNFDWAWRERERVEKLAAILGVTDYLIDPERFWTAVLSTARRSRAALLRANGRLG